MVSPCQNDTWFYNFFAGIITGYFGPLRGNDLAQIATCPNDCHKGLAPSDPGLINRRGLWGLEESDP
jgi:hypothetical protein